MTAPYQCDHKPRCRCAEHVGSLHRQLCDALNACNALRREREVFREGEKALEASSWLR